MRSGLLRSGQFQQRLICTACGSDIVEIIYDRETANSQQLEPRPRAESLLIVQDSSESSRSTSSSSSDSDNSDEESQSASANQNAAQQQNNLRPGTSGTFFG